jgi:arylsulfatase A-like enzyme
MALQISDTVMKKNIVFIHMESLNQQIFANRQWFPAINAIYQKSIRLNRFFSSATSTFMAMSDLLHGDDMLLEHNRVFGDEMTVNKTCRNIFDILKTEGYETLGTESPTGWDKLSDVWREHNNEQFIWEDVCKDMLSRVEAHLQSKAAPMALYFWNPTSHICCFDRQKLGQHGIDYWQRGWANLDRSTGELFRLLMKYNQLDNTIVIAYGDHGDDFWTHGANGGYSHAIEPYTSLIHTPAFIYHPGLSGNDINQLISMVDIKKIALSLLNIPDTDPVSAPTFDLNGGRTYCFSRNLSAAQPESKKNQALRKGYGITSDYFHLMKTVNGYEMYSWTMDPGNHFNLLNVFTADKAGNLRYTPDKFMKKTHEMCHPHYKSIIYPATLDAITKSYSQMKAALDTFINNKHQHIHNYASQDTPL